MSVLMANAGRVDVEGFWNDGYTIVRGVYSPKEIERFRESVAASRGLQGDLLANAGLRGVLVDGRLVDIARRVLGRDEILYAGDSSFSLFGVGTRQGGWHKDNADRKDPNGPDWRSPYTILRFGVYLQDHRWHSGGLNLRVKSHNTTDHTAGRPIYVRTGVGDVGVWSLRTTHSGHGMLLRFPWWVYPEPRAQNLPRWYRVAKPNTGDRMALFAALGLDDAHHDRYIEYLKTRKYMVDSWKKSSYDDKTFAVAARIGLKVCDVGREIAGDATVGQNVGWAPLAY